ncbi:SusC/RagA family TonB-linked outer membrane protein [Pontibacter silvestris]|uniref:SusC/RagA family TonB-linked outer membrane protein n=1 Tax=Pontibacter silvestris TaxID=2305183 RepID=A0ABW4WSS5_9BACT|nr:TonB-dependent receptor [Pontibacter silvestris]MCC9138403.1 TonB-dependent receptor [Pontibacter silvestris]
MKKKLLLLTFFLLHFIAGYSQELKPILGTVKDGSGSPLIGVSVTEAGTQKGAITDVNGSFQLNNVAPQSKLIFTYIGYLTKEVTVGDQATFNITLEEDAKALEEVVVVGYGTQKKVNVTGAVSAVKGDDLNWKPVGQTSAALQGVASGVTVTQSTGQPGSDQGNINIRGIGTLNNNDPLVLVDGVQYNINDIDPNDIESISVLKDAAAASIYGVRAANGVILITTKRGGSGKPRVTYNNYFGWQEPTRLSKFVGAQSFMELANLMYQNSGSGAIYSDEQIAAYNDPNRDVNQYPDNYWLDKILTGSGFQQSHSLSVGGGTDNAKYRFSTNYFDQKGLIKNMDFERLTVRLNTDVNINEKLSFSSDISAKISDRREPQGIEGSTWYQFGQAAIINPLTPDRYADGSWAIVRGGQNPLRFQEEGGIYSYKDNLFTGNFRADYTLLKGLKLTGMASVNYQSGYTSQHNKAFDYVTEESVVTLGRNDVTKQSTDNWFKNFQGFVEYQKDIANHSFRFFGGASRLSRTTDELTGYRQNLPNGNLEQIDAGAADGQTTNGTADEYALESYFGRINYSFNEKYLLEANIRRDGSSRFATGQKWGTFPSFSAGWRISGEEFMQSVGFLQELKLRGSWGKLGNDNIGNYPYQTTVGFNSYPFGGVLNTTGGLTAYPNSSLSWEVTQMTDIGLDVAILSGKVDAAFDYFIKNTDDILLQLPIPSTVGLSAPYQNAGSVRNTGWELALNYHGNIGQDFKYDVGANLSDVKNEIRDLKDADYITTDNNGITTAYQVGDPIGAFYGYEVEGIFQTADEVSQHATQPGTAAPGDLIYKDQNNDEVINAEDRVYLGSNIPRYTYGLNLNSSYKGFGLTAFFQGVAKVDINTLVLKRAPYSTDGNFKEIHQDSWTPENTDAAFPRLTTSTQNYQSSSYWIESGAYLRLKSLQVSYNLPSEWVSKVGLARCRIYASGQNLLTWSKLDDDIDPEAPNDSRYYPQVKTYTFGLNLEF